MGSTELKVENKLTLKCKSNRLHFPFPAGSRCRVDAAVCKVSPIIANSVECISWDVTELGIDGVEVETLEFSLLEPGLFLFYP